MHHIFEGGLLASSVMVRCAVVSGAMDLQKLVKYMATIFIMGFLCIYFMETKLMCNNIVPVASLDPINGVKDFSALDFST